MADPYETLGISRSTDRATIDAAYQRRRAEYAGDELSEAAAACLKELDAAYEQLVQAGTPGTEGSRMQGQRSFLTTKELIYSVAGAIGALAVLGLLWVVTGREQADLSLIRVNNPAPAFELPALDGSTIRLEAFRGKVVVVNFWATWCVPCREEAPVLVRVHNRLQDQGLVIIGVNLRNQEQSDADVQAFANQFGFNFPVALDTNGEVARSFNIYPIPVTYFLDAQGTIRYIRNGTLTEDEIEQVFNQMRGT